MTLIRLQLLLLNAGQRHGLHPAGHGRVVCIVGLGHVVPPLPFHAPAPVSKVAGSEGANQGSGQHRRGPIDRPESVRRARSTVAATTHACEHAAVQPIVGGERLLRRALRVFQAESSRLLHGSRDCAIFDSARLGAVRSRAEARKWASRWSSVNGSGTTWVRLVWSDHPQAQPV